MAFKGLLLLQVQVEEIDHSAEIRGTIDKVGAAVIGLIDLIERGQPEMMGWSTTSLYHVNRRSYIGVVVTVIGKCARGDDLLLWGHLDHATMRRIGDQRITIGQAAGKSSSTQSLVVTPHDGAIASNLDDAVVALIDDHDIAAGQLYHKHGRVQLVRASARHTGLPILPQNLALLVDDDYAVVDTAFGEAL